MPRKMVVLSISDHRGLVYSGIVRHMRAAKNGDLLIHQSATNRIMRVSVSK